MKSVLLKFNKLNNARDLGGMRTYDGRKIKSGKLIRSEHLTDVSNDDKDKLISIVETVIDLRTRAELTEKPDAFLDGVEIKHIPIIESLAPGITPDDKPDDFLYLAMTSHPGKSKDYMCDMYRSFALNDYSVSQYARFVKQLTKERKKAVLFHCTAGKDRAGTASAIIEMILGVPKEDVTEDYLKTNEYLENNIKRMTEEAKRQAGITGENAEKALYYLFSANEDYIASFFNAIETRYGSFDSFIENGMGISGYDVSILRKLYLE